MRLLLGRRLGHPVSLNLCAPGQNPLPAGAGRQHRPEPCRRRIPMEPMNSRSTERSTSLLLPFRNPQRHLCAILASRSAIRATLLARAAHLLESSAEETITLGVCTDTSRRHSRNSIPRGARDVRNERNGTGRGSTERNTTERDCWIRDANAELRTPRTDTWLLNAELNSELLNSGEYAADARGTCNSRSSDRLNSEAL